MNIEDKKQSLLFKRGGTCQEERLLQNLFQNNRLIESKGLDDNIVFIYLYSDLLQFYENQHELPTRNIWRNFLEHDDTVIYSLILHTQINKLREPISNYLLLLKRAKYLYLDNKYLKNILSILEELLILFNYWYGNLSSGSIVKIEIYNLIKYELNENITVLYNIIKQESNNSQISIPLLKFIENLWDRYEIWEWNERALGSEFLDKGLMHQQIHNSLVDLFASIFNGISNLQKMAREGYSTTLVSQTHKPQAALIIAFLRLLGYAIDHMNHIPQRHLDHYYRNVLKFREEPIKPDRVFVHFELKKNKRFFFLPKGSQLLAGKSKSGANIVFATDKAITINHAKVSKIHTFRIKKYATDMEEQFPRINLNVATYDPEILYKQKAPLDLFVPNTLTKKVDLEPIGILISSPVLYLREGKREIKVGFKFNKETFQNLLNSVKNSVNNTSNEVYDKIATEFKEIINIQVTTEKEWTNVAKQSVSINIKSEENYLEIIFFLLPDVLSITKFDELIHGKLGKMEAPAIRILLLPESPITYMFLFRQIAIETVFIRVNVTDYRGLILQNDLGLIDTSQPFQPFGAFPKLHSNFYIGSDEIFYKDLTKFKINITWLDLPKLDNGFQKYYEAYPGKITTQDFKVNIAYLKHRQWNPFYPENRQQISLFEVEKKLNNTVEILKDNRTFEEIDLDKLSLLKEVYSLNPPLWTTKTITGFIKLQLDSPSIAFGHTIYPAILAQNSIAKAKKKQADQTELPIVNEPYTPIVKSLSVDYSAEDKIDFRKSSESDVQSSLKRYIRIMPFGYKKEFPNSTSTSVSYGGEMGMVECFFTLGIQNLNTTILRLYIQLDESSVDADQEFAMPSWSYLADNNWVQFKENEIIIDDTRALTKSGEIVFVIPDAASYNNTVMSPGYIWLRVSFSNALDSLPRIIGIYTQMVAATRKIDTSNNLQPQSIKLPAYTIQALIPNSAAIDSITQPYESFGGKESETQTKLYTRISERLRHKNRAISAWDYERITLEKFPEIFRVKCINHSKKSNPFVVQPGKITLVVIPVIKINTLIKNVFLQVSKQKLEIIKQYLQKKSSSFVTIEVINPVYEEIKINLEVKFKRGYEKGIYSNELQKAIKSFLSPWLFNQSEDIRLGQVIPSSKIMELISKQNYIEAIGNFSILKYTGSNITKITDYDNQLMATYPWSVMVSSETHRITLVDSIDPNSNLRYGGMNDMSIEDDFIIGPWRSSLERDWSEEVKEELIQESLEEYYLVTKKHIKH